MDRLRAEIRAALCPGGDGNCPAHEAAVDRIVEIVLRVAPALGVEG